MNELTEEQLNNAHFSILKALSPQQQQMLQEFGRNMYSDLSKYSLPTTTTQPRQQPELKCEQLLRMIDSGLLEKDLTKKELRLLKREFGRKYKNLFQ